jgi:hypothetical protein
MPGKGLEPLRLQRRHLILRLARSATPAYFRVIHVSSGRFVNELAASVVHRCLLLFTDAPEDLAQLRTRRMIARGGREAAPRLDSYGVSGCVPQSPLNSLMSGVCVTWKSPLPSALTV